MISSAKYRLIRVLHVFAVGGSKRRSLRVLLRDQRIPAGPAKPDIWLNIFSLPPDGVAPTRAVVSLPEKSLCKMMFTTPAIASDP